MYRKLWIILIVCTQGHFVWSQETRPPNDTLPTDRFDSLIHDTSFLMDDDLFHDLTAFIDSISNPHSYFLANVTMGKGYFNFQRKDNTLLEAAKKFMYTPSAGYFHKSGLGLSATGFIINDDEHINFYQLSVTPAFDYVRDRRLTAGISYSRYFTKDSLPFYTTPLQNELYAYFTYRKWWIRPTVSVSYGWGSRSEYTQREDYITSLRLRPTGFTRFSSTESVCDLSIVASVRHDFYWLDILTYNDHIRFTPQLSFTSGTQNFGFNQTANSYATMARTDRNVLYSSQSYYLDDKMEYQPLAVTLFLRSEYAIGKLYFQPQVAFDYYFPAEKKNFNTVFSISAGFML